MSATPDVREIEELLPWYAAGTLDAEETAKVEAALVAHPELRRNLVLAEEEMGETIARNEALGVPSTRALEALFARIDAEPLRRPSLARRLRDLGGRLSEWFSPRTAGWAAITAGLVIAAQLAFHFVPAVQDANRYATANKEEPVRGGTFLLVAFQPDAKVAAVNDALTAVKAVIADGPRSGGLYRLRIGPAALPEAEARRIAETLAADRSVVRLVLRSTE